MGKTVVVITPKQQRDLERGNGFATVRDVSCPECEDRPPLILERGKGDVVVCYSCHKIIDIAVEKEEAKTMAASKDAPFDHDQETQPAETVELKRVDSEWIAVDAEGHILELYTHDRIIIAVLEKVFGLKAVEVDEKMATKRFQLPLPKDC